MSKMKDILVCAREGPFYGDTCEPCLLETELYCPREGGGRYKITRDNSQAQTPINKTKEDTVGRN